MAKYKEKNHSGAVVLFSGGIDSLTALLWARKNFYNIIAMIFNYSQKHSIETKMAEKIASSSGVKYQKIEFSLKNIVNSALINKEKDIPESLSKAKDNYGIPFTYVPFRNGIFLSIGAGFAESRGIFNIVTGFNLIDTPDYPDTTEAFTTKMEDAINQGTSASITHKRFKIHTPLIRMSKREIIEFGLQLGADYSYSISCYRGSEIPCFKCPSCDIRSNAFKQLNMEDPLVTRLKKEGRI